MVIKLITFLFGRLTTEQKQQLLVILNQMVKSAAQGAVAGAVDKNR